MGTILQGTCSKCGYHAELYTGGGISDCRPETALKAAGNHPKLAEALREHAWFRIDRKLAICKYCRKFVVVSDVIYQQKNGQRYRIAGTCPNCGRQPVIWQLPDTSGIPCPVCGQSVTLKETGHWD